MRVGSRSWWEGKELGVGQVPVRMQTVAQGIWDIKQVRPRVKWSGG